MSRLQCSGTSEHNFIAFFSALGDLGECTLANGHVVNPLKLQGSMSLDDFDPLFTTTTNAPVNYYRNRTYNHIRERRDTEKVVNTRIIIDNDGHRHQVVSMVWKKKIFWLCSACKIYYRSFDVFFHVWTFLQNILRVTKWCKFLEKRRDLIIPIRIWFFFFFIELQSWHCKMFRHKMHDLQSSKKTRSNDHCKGEVRMSHLLTSRRENEWIDLRAINNSLLVLGFSDFGIRPLWKIIRESIWSGLVRMQESLFPRMLKYNRRIWAMIKPSWVFFIVLEKTRVSK